MSSAKDHDTTRDARVRNRLAEIRQKRGLAAAALATEVGVSRQTIYAMESGTYVPNTAVALRLARALEVSVEDLFRLESEESGSAPQLKAELVGCGDAQPGTPVTLCRVGNRLVGVPVSPAPIRLPVADGLIADPTRSTVQLFNAEPVEQRLLVAGCDPSTPVLAEHLRRASIGLVSAPVNSSSALELLKKRLVHIAGTHLESADTAPKAVRDAAVFVFAGWQEGLVVARGNPRNIRGIEDLAQPRIRIANREVGSGSRQLLDVQLAAAGIAAKSITGYSDPAAPGHLAAAWRVHSGIADCCIATWCAANAFGLQFIPVRSERYDLVIRREHLQLAAVERFLDTLSAATFRRELEGLCGYDTRETGRRLV